MKIIKTKVIGDTITPIEQGYVIENQVNQYAIEFDFDETWDFEEKYCIFQDEFEEQTFKRAIINNQVIVPSELLNGRITIQVYGQNIEDNVITQRQPSLKYVFSILNSLPANASEEQSTPTPTQWELYISQIEEMCNDLQDQFDDLKEDCEQKCNNVIDRVEKAEQNIQTNTDNIRTNAENIDKLNNDLLDYSLITETGNKISMSINSQTYVITLSLKDKNDNVLSTQSVDLPLETMIVSASYSNGVLTFTLKNGQTLQVPISDLINGLVSTDTFNQAVQGLSNRISTIENDYLKSTDKTELQNQITANADDISDIKGEQLTQNADIESLQQENERLSRIVSGLPTKQASGTNFVLNDMVNCEIKEISLKGDTLQISDNKMITTNQNYYINGTATAYGKGGDNTGVAIPIIPNATYTIKATTTLSRYRIGTTATLGDSGSLNNGAIYDGTSTTATITSSDSYLIINANDLTKINITTSTPTPSSPIDIQTVTGNQTIQFSGKNLLNLYDKADSQNGVSITIKNGEITLNGTATSTFQWKNLGLFKHIANIPYQLIFIYESGTCTNYQSGLYLSDNPNTTQNVGGGIALIQSNRNASVNDSGTKDYYLYSSINNGCTFSNYKVKVQIVLGETADYNFEQFKQVSELPISLGTIELNKIGNYQDKIYKSNDKWYLEKNVRKILLNSDMNWFLAQTNTNTLRFGSTSALQNGLITNSIKIICNNFPNGTGTTDNSDNEHIRSAVGEFPNYLFINIDKTRVSDLTEFNEWLNNNETIVYYILNNPVITEITDTTLISQLEALNNYILLTNNTIISNGNLPVVNDITGYVDIMSLLSTQDTRNVVEEKKIVTKPVEEPIDEPIEEPIETKEEER